MTTEAEAIKNPLNTSVVVYLDDNNLVTPVKESTPLPINIVSATNIATENTLSTISDNVKGSVLTTNSTITPLVSLATFTGQAVDVSSHPSVILSALTDKAGVMYCDFSIDGDNWDSTLTYNVAANTNEVHRVAVTRKYFRARFYNSSATDQTFLRLQCLRGMQSQLTSSISSAIQQDADGIVVRPLDFNLLVSEGLYQDRNATIKDGLNTAISTGTVPEDLSNEGGVYAGFPATAAASEIVVSGADVGTVYYSYMATDTDLDYTFATKAINGAGTYTLGHSIWRCNFAYFIASTTTVFNVGTITVRQTATPSVIFCRIDAGFSQTFCAAYTVPYLSSIYLDRVSGNLRGSTSGQMEGYFWYKGYNESPRLRFPFDLQFGSLYFDDIDYLVKIPSRTDIVPRITYCSANSLSAKISYRFIKVKT